MVETPIPLDAWNKIMNVSLEIEDKEAAELRSYIAIYHHIREAE